MNISDEYYQNDNSSFFDIKYRDNNNMNLIAPICLESNDFNEDEYQNSLLYDKFNKSNDVGNHSRLKKKKGSLLPLDRDCNNNSDLFLKRGSWTLEEDMRLVEWIKKYGTKSFKDCKKYIGRVSKQCRERWFNVLNPEIKKGNWNEKEDKLLFNLYKLYGTKWSKISQYFKGRSENALKNRFYSTLRKFCNVNEMKGNKISTNDLKHYVPKVIEYFHSKESLKENNFNGKNMVDNFLNTYSNNNHNHNNNQAINTNFINSVYDKYNKMTEDSLERSIKEICNDNPFKESIPMYSLINEAVDNFVGDFFNDKDHNIKELEFCGRCLVPKVFQKKEKENIEIDSFSEENKQIDDIIEELNNMERTIKDKEEVIRKINDCKKCNSM